VQRTDHEPFQRMGLFGAGRKKAPTSEPVLVRPKPKPVMAGAAPETEEEKAAREADEAAFQAAAKPAEARLDQPDARDSSS
jgi:hypothetical protein